MALSAGLAIVAPGIAMADPLNPGSFTSLGTMNVTSGSITINTNTLGITGAATFNGGTVSQGVGNPEVAVFTFNNFNIGAGVTINIVGSRPLALLSQGTISIASAISVNGGNAVGISAGAAGPAGGFAGGAGGTAGTAGGGPGGAAASGALSNGSGGGFGGSGGIGWDGPTPGASYGDLLTVLQGGSGGSGAKDLNNAVAGGGGGGGGGIEIGAVGALSLSAALTSNGGAGADITTSGGGGAGGGILLHAASFSVSTLSAQGGNGGNEGGGGGGGRIVLVGGSLIGSQITNLSTAVTGAAAGFLASPGRAGVLVFKPDLLTLQSAQSVNVGITPGQTGRTDPRVEVLPKSLTVQSGGTATLISPITWTSGSVAVTGGALTVNSDTIFITGAALNVSAGTLNLPAGRQLSFSGATGAITPNVSINGTVNLTSATLSLGGDTTFSTGSNLTWNSGTVIVASGKTLTINGGAVDIFQGGKSVSNGSTLRVMNGGRFTGNVAFDIASAAGATGTVNVDGPGSLIEAYGSFGRIAPSSGNAATVTISNSAHAHYDEGLQIAATGGTALVNISSNASLSTASLIVGSASPGAAATVNLNGGSVISYGPLAFRNGAVVNHTAGAFSAGGTLATSGNGQLLLSTGGDKVPQAFRLNMSGTSKIDLADNDMIIAATSPTTIRSYIQTGRNGGDWLGNFLTSSSAAADPTHYALGYAQASDIFGGGGGTFDGIAVSGAAVLVKYTHLGDANLDGEVDINDLYRLASNYNGSGTVWTRGDFNYDGLTNVADLTALAMNWQSGVGSPLTPDLGAALASLGLSNTSIPEPSLFLLLPMGAIMLRRRTGRSDA